MEQNDIQISDGMTVDRAVALMIEVEEIFEAIRHGEMEVDLDEH